MGGFLNLNESFEQTFGPEIVNLNEAAQKVAIKMITDLHEAPEIAKKYPKAVNFFNKIYMRQDFQDILPVLEDLVTGDEVRLSKVEEAFSFLERGLK